MGGGAATPFCLGPSPFTQDGDRTGCLLSTTFIMDPWGARKPPIVVHVCYKYLYLIHVYLRPDEPKRQITVHPKKEEKARWSDFLCPGKKIEVHHQARETPGLQAYRCICIGGILWYFIIFLGGLYWGDWGD